MKCLWVWALLVGCVIGAWGQEAHSGATREFPAFKVYPGTLDEGGFPVTGARLCTSEAKAHCFALAPQVEEVRFVFGLRPKSQRIKLDSGGSLVLFNANCGGGSGSGDRYVLLRSEPDGQIRSLLPEILVSNQADVAVWDLPTVSPMPVFVTADALWEDGAHYSPHFFEVKTYVYDPIRDRYKLRRTYRTAHRYSGIDNWDSPPEVLQKERVRIVGMLGVK
jgi:hypothetical protein